MSATQTDFGGLAGVRKGTQISWEKDASSPPISALEAWSTAGADALYIVTGQRRDAPVGHWEAHHTVDSIEKTLGDPSAFATMEELPVANVLEAARRTLTDIATSQRSDVTDPTREKADNLLARHFNDEDAARRRSARYASLMVRRQHASRDLKDALAAWSLELPRDLHHQLLMLVIDYQIDTNDLVPLLGELSKLLKVERKR